MSDRLISDLCPELQPLAKQFLTQCQAAGIRAFLTETYRSCADQNCDYAEGRTMPGHIITNAQGGQSPHNCTNEDGTPGARAFDFAIMGKTGALDWNASDEDWQAAIRIGESLGLVSGSHWHIKDNPHFELADWHNGLPNTIT
jgi:peptidoglycan L-alanyl-D-glutamate endopeptidase CwlK